MTLRQDFARWLALAGGPLLGSVILAAGLLEVAHQTASSYLAQMGVLSSTRDALRLTPARADLHRELAFLDPDNAVQHLRSTLLLNPSDTKARTQLALLQEAEGRFDQARIELEEAARRELSFNTSWNLANFYFRRSNQDGFWVWVKRAATYVDADLSLLIDLCLRQDPNVERTAALLPRTCGAKTALLQFLTEAGRFEEALPAGRRLMACSDPASTRMLVDFISQAVLGPSPLEARDFWNQLARNGRIPFTEIEPARNVLTNGQFTRRPSNKGFDWRFEPVEGVELYTSSKPARLRLELNGLQPVATPLLWQPLILEKDVEYELTFAGTTDSKLEKAGLYWRLGRIKDGTAIIGDSEDWFALPGVPERRQWKFRSPADSVSLLILHYNRPAGQKNLQGTVALGAMSLQRRDGLALTGPAR